MLVGGSPNPTHAVDVTATLDAGVASLQAHRQYLEALSPGTAGGEPGGFLRDAAHATGARSAADPRWPSRRCGSDHGAGPARPTPKEGGAMSNDPKPGTPEAKLEAQLEEVQEEIEAAQEVHRHSQGLPEGQLFVDSGTVDPDLDDQTIAPG